MFRRACLLLAVGASLAACVQGPTPYVAGGYVAPGYRAGAIPLLPGGGPAPARPKPVAILAPLTGPNAGLGQALVNAAKLALDGPDAPELDVRDTGGSAQGAAEAARAAIAAGDQMIVGPLTGAETAGAAAVTRPAGVPMLAFTNDPAQQQPGVWTLGITPDQQVRRLVGAVEARGKMRFAAVVPEGPLGHALAAALTQATSATGAPAPDLRTYPPTDMERVVRGLAGPANIATPLLPSSMSPDDLGAPPTAAAMPAPFDALLVGETGARLAALTNLLAGTSLAPPSVRLLGLALWSAPAARDGAKLDGAWYAAPDPAVSTGFEQQYSQRFGSTAPGLADVAFDAASIARVLAHDGGLSVDSLCRPDGFSGVDGVFALLPSGAVRRGLALFQIDQGEPHMIEPAPTSLSAPGI